MGELQRLEDIEIARQSITLEALCKQLEETGEAVRNGKGFSYEVIGDRDSGLNIDAAIVMRVCENLLANAVRFAKEKIMVSVELQDGYLHLAVSDDGAGFAKKDLENATKPFYKTVRLSLRRSGSDISKPRPSSSEKIKTVSLHGLVELIKI